jgi:hypothetical protein
LDKTENIEEVISTLLSYSETFIPEIGKDDVKRENILKGLSMELADADDYLLELIDRLTLESIQLIQSKTCFAVYSDLNFDLKEYKITVFDQVFETGKTVTQLLKKSEAIVVFACTCGSTIGKYSKKLLDEGSFLEGLLVDLIGSELAESITEHLHVFIAKEFGKAGFNVSNRFSPGYCNWSVSEQQKLFPLLPAYHCGIQLTPSSLMIPIKSVSGILGVGVSVKNIAYKCEVCSDQKCILRRLD